MTTNELTRRSRKAGVAAVCCEQVPVHVMDTVTADKLVKPLPMLAVVKVIEPTRRGLVVLVAEPVINTVPVAAVHGTPDGHAVGVNVIDGVPAK